ncbi:MAG: sigma-70 family RNA polymerase sigma factor [Acidimicrobiia bacterium]|nr:sigma-70 family RNA polymerase sigma factor [Acidimicrobiia bacterium]
MVSIARRYLGPGVSILDLVQEGNVGLMKAAARYDYRRGFKFSTFAVWSIRQFVGRALNDQRRMIRLPRNVADTLQVMVASGRRLSQELGRPPTTEELGADLDLPVEKVRKITEIAGGTLSLDATLDSHDDLTLGQVVADRDAESPGESIAQQLLQEKVALALEQLADREREVVIMRFGLADGQVRTLQEVSREMGVTKERIRQMETRALEKLRSSGTSGSMESYLRGA